MYVEHFFVKGLAHSSYLLGGEETCAIVDPQRDIEVYLHAAEEMGMKITHILETHLHADFVSGHLDLADATGATIYAPKSARCRFEHRAVAEGDTFRIENMRIRVLETPGHTPEHVSYVVTDRGRGKEPAAVFCGDTLFVGDVGRPDLFPGKARELAHKLYDSLHDKLMALPDFCDVYPSHGAGSLCGRAMGAKRWTTIGYERRYNPVLQISDREEFIRSLTTNMPAAPDHFSRCSAINGRGPARVHSLPGILLMNPTRFARAARKKNTVVLDIRGYDAFGGQHVPGAFNIDISGNFSTFAGWVLPPDQDILLVGGSDVEAYEAGVLLRRVGLDRVVGYLDGGMFEWSRAGLPAGHVPQISVRELHQLMKGRREFTLVDVRSAGEYEALHIEGAVNIPAPDLRTRHGSLKKSRPIAVICSTGHRSSLSASLLKRAGFANVCNVAGGMMGYSAAGYSAQCPMCVAPHVPAIL